MCPCWHVKHKSRLKLTSDLANLEEAVVCSTPPPPSYGSYEEATCMWTCTSCLRVRSWVLGARSRANNLNRSLQTSAEGDPDFRRTWALTSYFSLCGYVLLLWFNVGQNARCRTPVSAVLPANAYNSTANTIATTGWSCTHSPWPALSFLVRRKTNETETMKPKSRLRR